MKGLLHIVILHPAAIGDAILATPVAVVLKRNFPDARITYWSHESLKPLLDMCPSIDAFVSYKRGQNIVALAAQLRALKPDLFVNLSNVSKIGFMSLFTAIKTVHYKKRPDGLEPIRHAADNFLDTIRPLASDIPERLFPTLIVNESVRLEFASSFKEALSAQGLADRPWRSQPLMALVPGVGKLRPNRSWSIDGWLSLAKYLVEKNEYLPVLIGGSDEVDIGEEIASKCRGKILNLCGKLSLLQTAVVLRECALVVSADTGPAHIAVAVGTPVVGLYGPTAPARSGPYGFGYLVVDRYSECSCRYKKHCRFAQDGSASGRCMNAITIDDVLKKIESALPLFDQDTVQN